MGEGAGDPTFIYIVILLSFWSNFFVKLFWPDFFGRIVLVKVKTKGIKIKEKLFSKMFQKIYPPPSKKKIIKTSIKKIN